MWERGFVNQKRKEPTRRTHQPMLPTTTRLSLRSPSQSSSSLSSSSTASLSLSSTSASKRFFKFLCSFCCLYETLVRFLPSIAREIVSVLCSMLVQILQPQQSSRCLHSCSLVCEVSVKNRVMTALRFDASTSHGIAGTRLHDDRWARRFQTALPTSSPKELAFPSMAATRKCSFPKSSPPYFS